MGPIAYTEDEDGSLLPLVVCKEYYKKGSVDPSDEVYDIDAQIETGERVHAGFSTCCVQKES